MENNIQLDDLVEFVIPGDRQGLKGIVIASYANSIFAAYENQTTFKVLATRSSYKLEESFKSAFSATSVIMSKNINNYIGQKCVWVNIKDVRKPKSVINQKNICNICNSPTLHQEAVICSTCEVIKSLS